MYRKIILIAAIVICICISGCINKSTNENKQRLQSKVTNKTTTEGSYKTYINDRFGFEIDYPSGFQTKLLSDNSDGVVFEDPEDGTELTVSGINNVLNDTAMSICDELLKKHSNASYKKQQGNWFAISWIEGDQIVYEKSVVGNGSINTFIIKYPSSKKEMYDTIIARLNSSFKNPLIDTSH